MPDIYETLKIDPQSGTPIYMQVVEGVERFCREVPSGSPLPPERAMAAGFGISRNSLRQAIAECCERGLLVQRWGKGIFTAEKKARKRILVLLSDNMHISMPWNYTLLGINERAHELSIEVEKISNSYICHLPGESVADLFRREQFTGILDMDYMASLERPALDALRNADIPVLFPHTSLQWAQSDVFPAMCIDERLAFREALEALVRCGHREIVTLGPFQDSPQEYVFRGYTKREYFAMLKEIGADPSPDLFLETGYDEKTVGNTLEDLRRSGRKYTAVMCFSDFYAIYAMTFLCQHKIPVPDEISVMGFCGYPGGKFMMPGLATVDFNYHQIGRDAVDRLLALPHDWRKMDETERIRISPHTLILRDSVKNIRKQKKMERAG